MKNLKRKSYDTRIKYLARKGLLPEVYRQQIHRSLVCKWKQEPKDKYVGYELNENIEELYDAMKAISDDKRLRKVVMAIYRINKTLQHIIEKKGSYIGALKKDKHLVIQTIEQSAKAITLRKSCRLLGISISTYRAWAKENYYKCNNSLLKLCSNSYPGQLTYEELKKMYRMFVDPQFLHWPIVSVAHYGIKHGIVKAHPNTWYKYFRLMNVKRYRIKKRRHTYPKGIRAKAPNEKWHADITELQLINGQIAYIYLVMDNYSRYILSWKISHKICAKTRLETFKEAITRSRKYNVHVPLTELIVDGGTENNNKQVDAFISEKQTLKKVIALKDILKSNSLIEYTNRTIKYEYLFPRSIYNPSNLHQVMQYAVFDYNNVRPQSTLNGLAPLEAFLGGVIDIDARKKMIKGAAKSRVNWNKTHNCEGCPFGCATHKSKKVAC